LREFITVLFDDFETLDAFGPAEILGRLNEHFTLRFVSQTGGTITSSQNVPAVTEKISGIPAARYVLLIPGGFGVVNLVKNESFLHDLKLLAQSADYVLTVCTGSVLLSKTGLLQGRQATSNKRLFSWAVHESPGVLWVKKARWIKDGNIYSSSGVSAGMDMTLGFVGDLLGYGTAKQQSIEIEYDWKEDARWDPFSEIY